jgi:signal transduction histidine kinase
LAITRRILHASDGEVSVVSEVGKGAEFTVSLPRMTPRHDVIERTDANTHR